jgi:hypothetical protein
MAKVTKAAKRKVDVQAAKKSRQSVRGLLEQTAVLAGRAVGIGARTAGRAAAAVGLSRDAHPDGQPSATVVERVTNALKEAVASSPETASNVADSTSSPRHITRQGRQPARRSTQTAKTSAAGRSVRKATQNVKSTGKRSKKSSPKRRTR